MAPKVGFEPTTGRLIPTHRDSTIELIWNPNGRKTQKSFAGVDFWPGFCFERRCRPDFSQISGENGPLTFKKSAKASEFYADNRMSKDKAADRH
jgi:hypothetical protein